VLQRPPPETSKIALRGMSTAESGCGIGEEDMAAVADHHVALRICLAEQGTAKQIHRRAARPSQCVAGRQMTTQHRCSGTPTRCVTQPEVTHWKRFIGDWSALHWTL